MPPKKSIVQEKPTSKVVKEVIVEKVSDNDSDSGDETEISEDEDENEDADEEESENEAENQSENKKETSKDIKEKLKKLTHEEILLEVENLNKENVQLDNEITDLDKQRLSKDRLRIMNRKKLNKLVLLLPKAYTDGCNKARKEKTRRTNSARSGILKEKVVPPILIKFLNLPENDLKSQSKLFHLMNEEFKKKNLKNGQQTILDKDTAETFGYKEGHIIEFKDHQRFLSDILNGDKKKTNEVSL